jgi:alpha-N-arabinofuranosidase
VKYWCVGNEMWGPWQLGFMKAEHYTIKHNWVVDTMRQVDPSFIPIASGNIGPWSEGLLRECAGRMDLIAEHFYCQERPGVLGHVRQIPDKIRQKAEAHREYRAKLDSLKGRDIRIAMTEWNYWYGPHPFGELGTRYFLKDGLGIAAGLHEYARQSDIIGAAFYAQTVNVIGCIKTSRTRAAMETTGLALQLYREHFEGTPVATVTGPLLDAQALLTPDGRHLVLGIVNPQDSQLEIPLTVAGVTPSGPAESWRIAGKDPMAFNDPDAPATVAIEALGKGELGATIRLAPYSATVIRVPVKP